MNPLVLRKQDHFLLASPEKADGCYFGTGEHLYDRDLVRLHQQLGQDYFIQAPGNDAEVNPVLFWRFDGTTLVEADGTDVFLQDLKPELDKISGRRAEEWF